MKYQSIKINLEYIVARQIQFHIPIYQRLYVWGQDQIETLLHDLYDAFKSDKGVYYLGGTLVKARQSDDGVIHYELIDGQQRFTTLWLLSLQWGQYLSEYSSIAINNFVSPRIQFDIRPDAQAFIDAFMQGRQLENNESAGIALALQAIDSFPADEHSSVAKDSFKSELEAFTRFIFDKVQLILTVVPEDTNLNKLFEVINNRGTQLQHHEILKARLLKSLPDNKKVGFGIMWDACANMNGYVEKNLKESAGLKLSPLFNKEDYEVDKESLTDFDAVLSALGQAGNDADEFSLEYILSPDYLESDHEDDGQENEGNDAEEVHSDTVESIISFSMLLQHTLRIWLNQRIPSGSDIEKILERDLLKIFDAHFKAPSTESTINHAEDFIRMLWKVRYLFDKYVIKWIVNGDERFHQLQKLRKEKNSVYRSSSETDKSLAMLQSMLYHSQQSTTHYWLSPYLDYLYVNGGKHRELYLQHLDNHMLMLANLDIPLIQRSKSLMTSHWLKQPNLLVDEKINYQYENGTKFPHYWFYKLEYILWFFKVNPKWSKFRMTAKNSVEHIAPQKPFKESDHKFDKLHMHSFGNLALVSQSINSEYGRLSFEEKKAKFHRKNQTEVDSLKMDIIFQNKEWTETLSEQHQKKMLEKFDQYIELIESLSGKVINE